MCDDRFVVINARLPFRLGCYQLAIADNLIQSIEPMGGTAPDAGLVVDVENDWLSLGAVDLQINGALGLAFPDLRLENLDRLQAVCDLLWRQGVASFCPTLVTTSLENFQGSLRAIATFQSQQQVAEQTAKVLGVHLEGPFLNREKRGAHPAEFLQPLTLENIKTVIGDLAEAVSIVTLAPEMARDAAAIDWLIARGITVSLGHSLATAEQAKRTFDQGATMVTHAFNAMPGLHHREPGLLGAALNDARVFCGFIADGQHISSPMLDLLLRAGRGGLERDNLLGNLFLVSDALSPLGLPDGTYPWDSREIEVVEGTARLADGTLSGTTLPLIKGAENLVEWGLCSVEEAIALVTQAPRRALGLGVIAPGSLAHLLRWHWVENMRSLTWQRLKLDKSSLK
ncbi:MAG: N-acetylglucosamine-6-phosphate deacetylase [Leptolyngbya foveolarum]|uniref:N-acetylglucosamine-6-phosphate deacetylase n=1 Tax=Leptolyngbya foveolarum TaxID=47253 RepID=A0A2W4UR61_9CYAN|nr:MAG: N-acetylglucosamine-6-phosphate deacetylase [Leptolyngbya foveolarum]